MKATDSQLAKTAEYVLSDEQFMREAGDAAEGATNDIVGRAVRRLYAASRPGLGVIVDCVLPESPATIARLRDIIIALADEI